MKVSCLKSGVSRLSRPPVMVLSPVFISETFHGRMERLIVDLSPVAMSIVKSECSV